MEEKEYNKRIKVIEKLTDGEFIDLYDRVVGLVYGLSATEFLLQEILGEPRAKEMFNKEYLKIN